MGTLINQRRNPTRGIAGRRAVKGGPSLGRGMEALFPSSNAPRELWGQKRKMKSSDLDELRLGARQTF